MWYVASFCVLFVACMPFRYSCCLQGSEYVSCLFFVANTVAEHSFVVCCFELRKVKKRGTFIYLYIFFVVAGCPTSHSAYAAVRRALTARARSKLTNRRSLVKCRKFVLETG